MTKKESCNPVDASFMWERVACFSEPTTVAQIERLDTRIAAKMGESRVGTHLMQRYWFAQWSRLAWADEHIADEKRFLSPNLLRRGDGKKDWKKMFVEEYPLWKQRTFQGLGVNNNAINEAKVLFHGEQLNETKTAQELSKLELTAEEARLKEQQKRGVEVEVDAEQQNGGGGGGGGGAHGPPGPKGKAPRPVIKKAAGESFSREDYKLDFRNGNRKGKHKKGGEGRWKGFDNFGDYEY